MDIREWTYKTCPELRDDVERHVRSICPSSVLPESDLNLLTRLVMESVRKHWPLPDPVLELPK